VGFALAPAWYQHTWFIPLCVIGALTVVALGFQMRVRTLRRRMQLVLAERSRIARELHDTLLQGFAGVTMEMQALSVRLPGESGERRTLDEIIRDAAVCLKEARRSVAGLRDKCGGNGGFAGVVAAAAREIAAGSDVEIVMRGGGLEKVKLPGSVEFTLIRIAREAVTNAVKHALAKRITIGLTVEPAEQLVMEIADDGVGFVKEAAHGPGHYGLMGMRERAEEIGAAFEIETCEGKGTVVRVRLNLQTGSGRGAMEKTAAVTE
jgi:signal transduction histidine kinase